MPKTLVMTFLDFAEAEGYNAALSRIEDIQSSLTDILEASDQPLHQLYAQHLLLAVNDIAIVLNHSYLKDIQHRAALAKGSIASDAKEQRDDNPITPECAECGIVPECAECGQPIHHGFQVRCVDCMGRDA